MEYDQKYRAVISLLNVGLYVGHKYRVLSTTPPQSPALNNDDLPNFRVVRA